MKAQLFRLKQKEKHCHNTCHKKSLEMLPKTGCATAVGVYLIKAVHNCMHDIGKSLRCPLKISCFLVPRHSPQLTSRWSARTLWKMSWTFLKHQTKSAQESRSTFHNLLCKVTGMGPLAAQQQMAKLLLESTLFSARWTGCLSGSSWRVTGRKWEYCYTKAKLQQIRTSISSSRPKLPFLLFFLE